MTLPRRILATLTIAASAMRLRGLAFAPPEVIRRERDRRVRAIVEHAWRTVPYYQETMRKLDLTPSDFRTADDLAKLPVMETQHLQKDPEYFLSRAVPESQRVRLSSSGSTGRPRTMWHDLRSLYLCTAAGERERAVMTGHIGRRTGYRVTLILPVPSSTLEMRRFMDAHVLLPPGLRPARQILSLGDPVEKNAALLDEFRPDVVYSYGCYFDILFPWMLRHRPGFHRPRLIQYSSERVTEQGRRLIEEELGIPILGTYQATEALKIGFECEHGTGYHLHADIAHVRLIDGAGQPAAGGEPGQVVLSNLVNHATVFLNYRLGDIARMERMPCPCGRTLPLLSAPLGRNDDLVELPSGRVLHPQALGRLFRGMNEVRQYRIVQEGPWRFAILVAAKEDCNRDAVRVRLVECMRSVAGDEAETEVRFVDSIPLPPNGKHRGVVSLRRASEVT